MRARIIAPAQRTHYLYADEGLIAETVQAITLNADSSVTASSTPQISTQYGPRLDSEFTTGTLFVKTKNSNNQDSFAYFHHDHLQTPLQATDKAGNVVWAASYNAFGKASITTPAATPDKPTITVNLRLPGQYLDEETGLHYNWHRYYDGEVGRYVTEDPIGLRGGVNRYGYVRNNPQSLIDPIGLYDSSSPWSVGWEWLTGTGPRHHDFNDGDPFTENLRKHNNIQRLKKRACAGTIPNQGKWDYSVGGWDGAFLFLHDYSNLLTGGLTGNLAVTYLGSYKANYTISNGTLNVVVNNSSTIQSATHPPVIGYTKWWSDNVGNPLDKKFQSGPMSKTTQTFNMTFDLAGDCPCQ